MITVGSVVMQEGEKSKMCVNMWINTNEHELIKQ